MAIHKKVQDRSRLGGETKHLVLPAFSFEPTDALAKTVVDAWASPGNLLERDPHTTLPTQRQGKKRPPRSKQRATIWSVKSREYGKRSTITTTLCNRTTKSCSCCRTKTG